jgi:hypothetical protein
VRAYTHSSDVHGSCHGDELVDVIIGDLHEAWRSLCSFLPQGPRKQLQVFFLLYVSSKKVVAKISMILCNLEREREKEDAT